MVHHYRQSLSKTSHFGSRIKGISEPDRHGVWQTKRDDGLWDQTTNDLYLLLLEAIMEAEMYLLSFNQHIHTGQNRLHLLIRQTDREGCGSLMGCEHHDIWVTSRLPE